MYEIRCPSCRLRLWLYQGMRRDVPLECPGCHIDRPDVRADVAAARIAARMADDRRAELAEVAADRRHGGARPPVRPGASR